MCSEAVQVAVEVGRLSAHWLAQQDGTLLPLHLLQQGIQRLQVQQHAEVLRQAAVMRGNMEETVFRALGEMKHAV